MRIITIIVLVCMGFPIALLSQPGSITNIQVSQRTDGSGNVDVYYNLVGTGSSYYLKMEVSFNDGSSFTAVPSSYLSGNVGVIPGTNRHIIWNGKGSNDNIYCAQTKVKLIADITMPCGQSFTVNHLTTGGVAPVNKSVTYGTVTNIPGEPSKCWIKSNLGADHQATTVNDATEPSAGWYWQFNRKQGYKHDGSIRTPNSTWITPISENLEWQAANDPCSLEFGNGWRIPTTTELSNIHASGGWSDWNGPWNSGLNLHAAGCLDEAHSSLENRGSEGNYWSSTQVIMMFSIGGFYLEFCAYFSCGFAGNEKAFGYTLRCIRD